jgi:formylmethanofuran:tetrahydromethanopterin formyltransferase
MEGEFLIEGRIRSRTEKLIGGGNFLILGAGCRRDDSKAAEAAVEAMRNGSLASSCPFLARMGWWRDRQQ